MQNILVDFNYYNPIEKAEAVLHIRRMPLDRLRLSNLKIWHSDEDIYNILNSLLKEIDLSRIFNGALITRTNTPRYESACSEYLFYVEKLSNHLEYNKWIDKLLLQHAANLVFEKEYIPPEEPKNKKSKGKSKKALPPDLFYKRQTFDMFTNDPIYEYINPRTGEIVKSDNPNLLNKLNAEIAERKNYEKKQKRKKAASENKEKIKINRSPDFSKLKFKF